MDKLVSKMFLSPKESKTSTRMFTLIASLDGGIMINLPKASGNLKKNLDKVCSIVKESILRNHEEVSCHLLAHLWCIFGYLVTRKAELIEEDNEFASSLNLRSVYKSEGVSNIFDTAGFANLDIDTNNRDVDWVDTIEKDGITVYISIKGSYRFLQGDLSYKKKQEFKQISILKSHIIKGFDVEHEDIKAK